MDTLLLQIVGPMQSWGVQSLHGDRDTGLEPSKSGVIGLVCAALGRDRSADICDLVALRMGVRVDREGSLSKDFHKAEPLDAQGNRPAGEKATIGYRRYLADAAFLVALEGEGALLKTVQAALLRPVYGLYLGRKAFVPAQPVWLADGLLPGCSMENALRQFRPVATRAPTRRRVLLEDSRGALVINDQPVSFSERRFAPRRVRIDFYDFPVEEPCISPN